MATAVANPPHAVGLSFRARSGEGELVGTRTATAVQRTVAVAIVPMVALTLALAFSSDHLLRPVSAGLYWSYLVAATIGTGLLWWTRRPASRFGPVLVVYGALAWVMTLQASESSLLFSLGVLVEAPTFVYGIYAFLAFPSGRVEPRQARWLLWALGATVLLTFLPWVLFSPVIAGAGPLTTCVPGCPPNALHVGANPGIAEVAGKAETYAALTLVAAVFAVYLLRVVRAAGPQRRALLAVGVTSLLFLPVWFVTNFSSWILEVHPETVQTMAWFIVGTRILIPLGFLLALVQADHFAGKALGILLERLADRPSPEDWRDAVAEALDDPEMRLAYRDPATGEFREPSGERLTPQDAAPPRAWVSVESDGHSVAAMVIDETLTEDPELIRAAATATLLAVQNGAMEGELRASRARIVEAGDAERRRIERDLHDGAQQRLVALRIHLSMFGEELGRAREQAMLESLGTEVDEAIDELRDLAHGLYPQLLAQAGLGAALAAVGRRSGLPVRLHDQGLSRYPEAVEMTVYFCCVECLQNAAKHAGPGATVEVRLVEDDGWLEFTVQDHGKGFDPAAMERGAGLTNLGDRAAAAGGTLHVESRPGRGTRVDGRVPCRPSDGGGVLRTRQRSGHS